MSNRLTSLWRAYDRMEEPWRLLTALTIVVMGLYGDRVTFTLFLVVCVHRGIYLLRRV